MFRTSLNSASLCLHVCHTQWLSSVSSAWSDLFPYSHKHEAVLRPANRSPRNPRRRSLSALTPMSHTHPTATSSSNTSNFQIIFNNALKAYQTRTKNDLLLHPLAAQLQTCDSPSTILAVLQEQARGLDRSRSGDERWTKWLDPTINVLFAFSATIGAGISLVCPRTSAFLRSAFSYLFVRFSRRRM
jgi:hypothetical protein